MKRFIILLISVAPIAFAPAVVIAQQNADPKLTEVWQPVPRLVTPGLGTAPPSDAIVLFSGKDLSQWEQADSTSAKWKVEDAAFTVVKGTGNIRTKRAFGDCQLHIEWRTPRKVEGEGQERGNSGIFLQGHYE
ncbi:MAG: 3-keto-disaccharide hydrolase, partial [Thermoanaerobaculia bacterium]